MAALPSEIPAFLRNPAAVRDVGELSREEDRSKGSGKVHDHNRDAGHFLDLDDEGKLLGGPPFLPLPATRADYEKALQVSEESGDPAGMAACVVRQGEIALERSEPEEAARLFREALPHFRRMGDILGEATCVARLGEIALARPDHGDDAAKHRAHGPLDRRVAEPFGPERFVCR